MTPAPLAFLLALAATSQDTVALRRAEAAFAAEVARDGLASAVARHAASDLVLLYGGAPVVIGAERAAGLLGAQAALDSLSVALAPADAWISADGAFGVSHGRLAIGPSSGPARPGTYIAGWRRAAAGDWRLAGLMVAGLAPPDRTVLRGDAIELPVIDPSGPAAAMIRADLDFAAHAGRAGAPDAFRTFAAPDAVMLGAAGPERGPAAIGALIGAGAPADWSWYPVAARIAAAGDLGFTVGQAVIQPKSGGAASVSKYLTVWRRQADGTMRFLTDGGNPRPRP